MSIRILALVCAFCLSVGCGDDESNEQEQEEQQEQEPQDLTPRPVTPSYGINESYYVGVQIDQLIADGWSGVGVDVCVVDSGIDANHPAFSHSVARNVIRWRDFTIEASATPVDTNGHGTHVTGIIAMDGELTGGAPNVNLLIARVFMADGTTDHATIAAGIDWCRTEGSDLISLSLGGLSLPAISALLQLDATETENAVQRALDAGIYVVAAAGNQELTPDVATPANVPGVISVGALTRGLQTKADFSQSGINDGTATLAPRADPDKKPELSAPGVFVRSAMVAGAELATGGCANTLYCELDGTSQATPFVTAAIALVLEAMPELKSDNPEGDPAERISAMKTALSTSASPRDSQDLPHDDGVGYGMVQAQQLLDVLESP